MSRIWIAGCGFLGEAAAGCFLHHGHSVLALTASAESAKRLRARGWNAEAADLGDWNSLLQVRQTAAVPDLWIHCASTGGGGVDAYRRVFFQGCSHLLELFPGVPGIFLSSTSVYGQASGEEVREDSETIPQRGTGRVLLETEDLVLRQGGVVLRSAGLYGPGRSAILRKVKEGTARIEGDGSRWINQIHRDDAARALLWAATHFPSGEVFNLVDDHPTPQKELLTKLSRALDLSIPPVAPPNLGKKRGWTNKRVSNEKLRNLGWQPAFPDFFDALPGLLEAGRW